MELIDRVREAIKNARENGYYMSDLSDTDVALDLCTYDSYLENENIISVIIAVHEVRMNG